MILSSVPCRTPNLFKPLFSRPITNRQGTSCLGFKISSYRCEGLQWGKAVQGIASGRRSGLRYLREMKESIRGGCPSAILVFAQTSVIKSVREL